MFILEVKAAFDAAHTLRHYQGNCARLHGHTWQVTIEVAGEKLDETGMLVDFRDLKKLLEKTVSRLDHTYLNDLAAFAGEAGTNNPTAENLAFFIWQELEPSLPAGVRLNRVRVKESENSVAEYRKGEL